MNQQKTIVLAGSTGLVGGAVLGLCLQHPQVGKVVRLLRKATPLPANTPGLNRVLDVVVDYANLPSEADWWAADALICTLGTTIKQAKTAEAFREADLHNPSRLASMGGQRGLKCFVLNSSTMANPKARGLYLQTKGQAEQAVKNAGIPSVVIARPGLLDAAGAGQRGDFRLGEEVGIVASRLLNPLLPKRLRSVQVPKLAAAMLQHALQAPAGVTVLESEQFQ